MPIETNCTCANGACNCGETCQCKTTDCACAICNNPCGCTESECNCGAECQCPETCSCKTCKA
uniref:Metallothionein n=1 Tax=Magallana gigas TaxID=29159 RepID=F6M9X3_MAGGI|nr:metallothionein [Crassostrea gigas]